LRRLRAPLGKGARPLLDERPDNVDHRPQVLPHRAMPKGNACEDATLQCRLHGRSDCQAIARGNEVPRIDGAGKSELTEYC
jgi:hypothetical protein